MYKKITFVHRKNDFAEVSKNLGRSENNFVGFCWKNNYVGTSNMILQKQYCKKQHFNILATSLSILHYYFDSSIINKIIFRFLSS